MAIKPIIYNIKELRKPCIPVEKREDISQIIQDLKDTLYSLVGKGYALAANQINYNKQITLIRIPLNKEHTKFNEMLLINPKIIEKDRKVIYPESCLSFPGITVNTDRYVFITYTYLDKKLGEHTGMAQDLEAIVIQHEISHLQGRTLFDFKHRSKR